MNWFGYLNYQNVYLNKILSFMEGSLIKLYRGLNEENQITEDDRKIPEEFSSWAILIQSCFQCCSLYIVFYSYFVFNLLYCLCDSMLYAVVNALNNWQDVQRNIYIYTWNWNIYLLSTLISLSRIFNCEYCFTLWIWLSYYGYNVMWDICKQAAGSDEQDRKPENA